MLPPRSRNLVILLVLVLAGGLAAWAIPGWTGAGAKRNASPLSLFGTLPIYWNEATDLSAIVSGGGEQHWVRALIERERPLRPIDVLAADNLAQRGDLLMAQPRALSPVENVALDDWVRAGGRVLLFADPMLTGHSHFAFGDRRRPQDIVLLSPILARWGLRLEFDHGQPAGEHLAELAGIAVPVDLPGRFLAMPTAPDAPADCRLLGGGLAADCAIGRGRALIVADAALLDGEGVGTEGREEALSGLMARAFSRD